MAENGNSTAIRKFKSQFPMLSESTVRTFKKKYCEQLKHNTKEELESSQNIPKYSRPNGSPFLSREVDQIAQPYILELSKMGGVVSTM